MFCLSEAPYSMLGCDCHKKIPGKTAVILGPLWYFKFSILSLYIKWKVFFFYQLAFKNVTFIKTWLVIEVMRMALSLSLFFCFLFFVLFSLFCFFSFFFFPLVLKMLTLFLHAPLLFLKNDISGLIQLFHLLLEMKTLKLYMCMLKTLILSVTSHCHILSNSHFS